MEVPIEHQYIVLFYDNNSQRDFRKSPSVQSTQSAESEHFWAKIFPSVLLKNSIPTLPLKA